MKKMLNGGCFVTHKEDLKFEIFKNWNEAEIIGKNSGSQALSQYFYEIFPKSESPYKSYSKADCILFILSGKGKINISGRHFDIEEGVGIYIKPGEAFSFSNPFKKLEIIATICPQTKATWLTEMPLNFQKGNNKRTVTLNERKKVATGDRFYQLLVGKKMGSKEVTQFIGSIPKSKAPDHFHMYEEAITILGGKGFMWAGSTKTRVKKGSMIFLPRKQEHCLECTVDEGLKLMGVFYPSGSPTVSYKTN